jgi:hypothetical protein
MASKRLLSNPILVGELRSLEGGRSAGVREVVGRVARLAGGLRLVTLRPRSTRPAPGGGPG